MIRWALAVTLIASSAFAQDNKTQVTVNKMTDAEYKRFDDAGAAMQKAAEEYRKAADSYENVKAEILGKYNAIEKWGCGEQKIVDIRGPYIIVELRPTITMNGITIGGCGTTLTTPVLNGGGTSVP
jgi:hypothetical protein